jgi:hypothetical protein
VQRWYDRVGEGFAARGEKARNPKARRTVSPDRRGRELGGRAAKPGRCAGALQAKKEKIGDLNGYDPNSNIRIRHRGQSELLWLRESEITVDRLRVQTKREQSAMSIRSVLSIACGIVLAAGLIGSTSWAQSPAAATSVEYDPTINPSDFVSGISNKYFTLKPGKKFTYKNQAGTEQIEILVTKETRKIMGVSTTVILATEWQRGVIKEVTRDWYAQDKHGNVWYFGEAVENYVDGKLNNRSGSWEAGVDGAKPGIIMLGNPTVGATYRQEYYKGKAEDMGTIVALDKKVTTPAGSFENCIQIRDWSRIEPASEYKCYCPAAGFLVLEESTVPGGGRVELISIASE